MHQPYVTTILAILFTGACASSGSTAKDSAAVTLQPPPASSSSVAANSGKQRVCPDAWYDNAQPGPSGDKRLPSEYVVVKGKRMELAEVDVEWIKSHCPITGPSKVE
jgi:hypothetical protein